MLELGSSGVKGVLGGGVGTEVVLGGAIKCCLGVRKSSHNVVWDECE